MGLVLDQDVRVVKAVVVVVELHGSTGERVLFVVSLVFLLFILGHQHALLQQLCRHHHRVSIQRPVVVDLRYTIIVIFDLSSQRLGLNIRVFRTRLHGVTCLLAAQASQVQLAVLFLGHLVFINLIAGVFLKFATEGILLGLTAAPPKLATVLALMRTAAPVEVLLLEVVLATLLARL